MASAQVTGHGACLTSHRELDGFQVKTLQAQVILPLGLGDPLPARAAGQIESSGSRGARFYPSELEARNPAIRGKGHALHLAHHVR